MILSTDLLKQVALKLNLSRLPEFDEAADMSLFSRLLIIAGLKSDPQRDSARRARAEERFARSSTSIASRNRASS